jgi:hypothetical protein
MSVSSGRNVRPIIGKALDVDPRILLWGAT